jgi:hypothetical protein
MSEWIMDPVAFEFRGKRMSEETAEELWRYYNRHCPTGSFLEAVICNDLREACALADDKNLWILPVIVAWLYNHAPGGCWGSSEKYEAWVAFGKDTDVDNGALDI